MLVGTALFATLWNPVLGSIDYSCVHSTAWVINNEGHTNSYFSGTVTDVTSSALASSVWEVKTNRIPNYDHKFTSTEISTLNSRPKASSDFSSGATTATAGQEIVWGQDIGYKYTVNQGCSLKYWPPGPSCPTAASKTYDITLSPAPETHSTGTCALQMNSMAWIDLFMFIGCYAPMTGALGYFVNGVSIYGWSDSTSYNSQKVTCILN
jgi:hypothetical protein